MRGVTQGATLQVHAQGNQDVATKANDQTSITNTGQSLIIGHAGTLETNLQIACQGFECQDIRYQNLQIALVGHEWASHGSCKSGR